MDDLKDYFNKAKHLLTPIEEQVMKFRFGIDGSPAYEVDEIAQELKFGVEEIREIETQAKLKLQKFRGQL